MKKKLTTSEFVSLAVIAIAAPVLALAIVVSARASAMAENDLLLFALTLCGAVVSGFNGFGRRTIKARSHSASRHEEPKTGVAILS
jgi:hypothetical protein